MANHDERKAPPHEESTGLEGAGEGKAGIIRKDEQVEGGEDLSIGGSPPSGAGGARGSPAPTRHDLKK